MLHGNNKKKKKLNYYSNNDDINAYAIKQRKNIYDNSILIDNNDDNDR